jgi:hypothetical protein
MPGRSLACVGLVLALAAGGTEVAAKTNKRVSRSEFEKLQAEVRACAAELSAIRARYEAPGPQQQPTEGRIPPPSKAASGPPLVDADQFAKAGRDSSCGERESRILQVLGSGPAGTRPSRVECRVGACRVEACYQDEQDLEQALSLLVSNLSGFRAGSVDRSTREMGCVIVWLSPESSGGSGPP